MIPELHLSLVSGPEHGDALADGGGVVMGKGDGIPVVVRPDALPHRIRVHEGVVRRKEKLLRDRDSEFSDRLRPVLEIINVDAQNTVDNEVRRDGYVRALLRHTEKTSRHGIPVKSFKKKLIIPLLNHCKE